MPLGKRDSGYPAANSAFTERSETDSLRVLAALTCLRTGNDGGCSSARLPTPLAKSISGKTPAARQPMQPVHLEATPRDERSGEKLEASGHDLEIAGVGCGEAGCCREEAEQVHALPVGRDEYDDMQPRARARDVSGLPHPGCTGKCHVRGPYLVVDGPRVGRASERTIRR